MKTTRRTVLKAAAAGAVSAFSGIVPGLAAAAQRLRVRRCVNDMKDGDPDLETYRDFVGIMLAKPQGDPVSWIGFANQHGDANDFKFCPHGDWYFLPWHREFVMMYERAASALTHNARFAMPYWDWTTLRDYPPAFAAPKHKGKANPLYVPGRNALKGPNALTDKIVGKPVMDAIYRETVYEAFGTSRNRKQTNLDPSWVPAGGGLQGTLERTPHNLVHNAIGAFMPESNSPRDPIFFMHHGNIDRIWATWNAMGRVNSTDPLWLGMEFKDNYIAPDGTTYTRGVKDLLDIAPLGYTYDRMPPKSAPLLRATRRDADMRALFDPKAPAHPQRIRKSNDTAATPGAPLSIPFSLEDRALLRAERPGTPEESREIVALISEIRLSDAVREIRVLVNHPQPSIDVPETDPHFVAHVSFLRHSHEGMQGHGKALPATIVNLTEALRNLAAKGDAPKDEVTVQLVPVPEPGAAEAAAVKVVPAIVEIAVL
jgi:tyrosinase